jgi:hypothetical protein
MTTLVQKIESGNCLRRKNRPPLVRFFLSPLFKAITGALTALWVTIRLTTYLASLFWR